MITIKLLKNSLSYIKSYVSLINQETLIKNTWNNRDMKNCVFCLLYKILNSFKYNKMNLISLKAPIELCFLIKSIAFLIDFLYDLYLQMQ